MRELAKMTDKEIAEKVSKETGINFLYNPGYGRGNFYEAIIGSIRFTLHKAKSQHFGHTYIYIGAETVTNIGGKGGYYLGKYDCEIKTAYTIEEAIEKINELKVQFAEQMASVPIEVDPYHYHKRIYNDDFLERTSNKEIAEAVGKATDLNFKLYKDKNGLEYFAAYTKYVNFFIYKTSFMKIGQRVITCTAQAKKECPSDLVKYEYINIMRNAMLKNPTLITEDDITDKQYCYDIDDAISFFTWSKYIFADAIAKGRTETQQSLQILNNHEELHQAGGVLFFCPKIL